MRGSVIIDGRLIGYRHGGIATYSRQLIETLPGLASGLDIRIALTRPVPELSDRSIRVITPPHHRFERPALGFELAARRPDLVHAVDYVQPFVPGAATVATVHDVAFLSRPDLVTSDSYRYYRQILETLPRADAVIVVSEWTRQRLLEFVHLEEGRVNVIPNGVDHTLFHAEADPLDKSRLSRIHPAFQALLASGRPIVLSVGTIEPRKRLDRLVRAFLEHYDRLALPEMHPPLLVHAGQAGWLSNDTIERLRVLQRKDRGIWIRDISEVELASLYRVSTLHVMPSLDEGFGLPVLEAMSSGLPSLVSNNGALPELVRDSGFIEESEDPADWASKIGGIISEEEMRTRRARRGVEFASVFDWTTTARRTLEVYRKVLAER